MTYHDDFSPTRCAAHEYSERSIQHSREFMNHPEAVQALGELAPRLIEVLDYLYVPETHVDSDGTLVVDLSDTVGPREVPVISAPAETSIRVVRKSNFKPDERQMDAIERSVEAILDSAGPAVVDALVSDIQRVDETATEDEFQFSKFGGLAFFALFPERDVAAQGSPIITLNMHGPKEEQANPYVLLHEALHAGDIINEPLIDLRQQGFYRHLLRYELRGYYVSAKVIELQEQYADIFRQYNTSYHGVHLIKTIEDARSRYNDFLGVDMFEPDYRIDEDLRRRGIAILGSHIDPDTILGE